MGLFKGKQPSFKVDYCYGFVDRNHIVNLRNNNNDLLSQGEHTEWMDFVDGARNYISAAVQDKVIGVAEEYVRRLRDTIYNEMHRTQRGIVTGVVDRLVGINEEELTQIGQVHHFH